MGLAKNVGNDSTPNYYRRPVTIRVCECTSGDCATNHLSGQQEIGAGVGGCAPHLTCDRRVVVAPKHARLGMHTDDHAGITSGHIPT